MELREIRLTHQNHTNCPGKNKEEYMSSYEYTKTYSIGDKITTDKFEIIITNVETRTKVGTDKTATDEYLRYRDMKWEDSYDYSSIKEKINYLKKHNQK